MGENSYIEVEIGVTCAAWDAHGREEEPENWARDNVSRYRTVSNACRPLPLSENAVELKEVWKKQEKQAFQKESGRLD